MEHAAHDPDFEAKVRESFLRQGAMQALGASLVRLSPGRSEVHLPIEERLTNQDGVLDSGVIASVLDSACGYATLSLSPPGGAVLAVEFKINFLSPPTGETFIARARVNRTAGGLSNCSAEGYTASAGKEKLVTAMLSTIMTVVTSGTVVRSGEE